MTTPTKTVEQLKEEVRIAEEALQKIQQENAEKIREAKYAEQRKKEEEAEQARHAKLAPHIMAVAAALKDAGVQDVAVLCWGIKIGTASYPDPDLQIAVEREEHASSGRFSFHTSYTGRHIMAVGDRYRDFPRARYPSKKDGSFNIAKIVATVTERISAKAAAAKREQEKAKAAESATELAARVSKALGFTDKYANPISGTQSHGGRTFASHARYYTTEAPAGKVFYQVGTLSVTPEQAKVLHDALVAIKAMEPKKEAS